MGCELAWWKGPPPSPTRDHAFTSVAQVGFRGSPLFRPTHEKEVFPSLGSLPALGWAKGPPHAHMDTHAGPGLGSCTEHAQAWATEGMVTNYLSGMVRTPSLPCFRAKGDGWWAKRDQVCTQTPLPREVAFCTPNLAQYAQSAQVILGGRPLSDKQMGRVAAQAVFCKSMLSLLKENAIPRSIRSMMFSFKGFDRTSASISSVPFFPRRTCPWVTICWTHRNSVSIRLTRPNPRRHPIDIPAEASIQTLSRTWIPQSWAIAPSPSGCDIARTSP